MFLIGIAMPVQAKHFEVVGTEVPPLMYLKNGTPAGFYVDILNLMIQDMKDVEISISFFPAPRMFRVLSENPDTFSLGVARNDKREFLYKWVGPIYPRIFALFRLRDRSDIQVTKLEDIRLYRIGVGRGYAAMNDLLEAGVPCENIEEVTIDAQNIRKLFARRIDFVVGNDVMVAYLLKQEGYQWNDVEQTLVLNDEYQFYYAFNKNMDDRIIQKFQDALDRLKQDGRYAAIVRKYF